jgi:hypothetical protein
MKKNLFLASALISTLGSSLSNIVLAYRFLLETENGLEYSIVMYAALAASILLPFIGRNIDRIPNSQRILPVTNIFLAICQIFLAQTYSLLWTFILIMVTTTLNSIIQSITFKCLPCMLEKQQLLRVNATLQEITTIGFIFGPIFAPLLTYTFHNDAILFYIDAITFFIAATLLGQCFKSTTLPNEAIDSTPSNFSFDIISSYKSIFTDLNHRTYLTTFTLFMMAFSPMAFALALIAKNASSSNPIFYSYPILSMFIGRLFSLRVISRLIPVKNLLGTFQLSLIASGILIFPLSFLKDLTSICIIEFFLGIVISQVNFTEKSYSQLICQAHNLAKFSTLKQIIGVATKIISITFVTILVAHENTKFVTPVLSLFFLTSGIYLVLKRHWYDRIIYNSIGDQHE